MRRDNMKNGNMRNWKCGSGEGVVFAWISEEEQTHSNHTTFILSLIH